MKIGFIVTNYNNSHYTSDMVESINKSDANGSPIIVVDNNSELVDYESLSNLSQKYSNMEIIRNNENVGYFSGLNIGIEHGRKNQPHVQFWIIGNNDLIFPEKIIKSIQDSLARISKYPVISPNIVTLDGVNQNPHVISSISKFREFIYDIYHFNFFFAKIIKFIARLTSSFTDRGDEQQHEIGQEIYQGYGACYILTPLFFVHFEKLACPTFLMYEEFFLSKQLNEKGFKTYYEPAIFVKHVMHATTSTLPQRKYWELSKNAHKEYRKYVKVWRR